MIGSPERQTAIVVPFPRERVGSLERPSFAADELRGVLLLFTGVRYERSHEPDPAAAGLKASPKRRRRS